MRTQLGRLRLPQDVRGRAAVACLVAAAGLFGTVAFTRGGGGVSTASDMSGQALRQFRANGFSVSLPCVPKPVSQTQRTTLGAVTVVGYACTGGTDGYGVAATTVPKGSKIDITNVAKGTATNLGGTASGLTSTTFQGHPAVDFRVADAMQGSRRVTVFARVVDAGSTLYELQYLKDGVGVTSQPADYQEFLGSLHIG